MEEDKNGENNGREEKEELDRRSDRQNEEKRNRWFTKKGRGGLGFRRNFKRKTVVIEKDGSPNWEHKIDEESDVRSECQEVEHEEVEKIKSKKVEHPLTLPRVKFLEKNGD